MSIKVQVCCTVEDPTCKMHGWPNEIYVPFAAVEAAQRMHRTYIEDDNAHLTDEEMKQVILSALNVSWKVMERTCRTPA